MRSIGSIQKAAISIIFQPRSVQRSGHQLGLAKTWLKPSPQYRSASRLSRGPGMSTRERWKDHWRLAKKNSPIILPFMIVATISSVLFAGFLLYDQVTRINPLFAEYPEKVEYSLRKALYSLHVYKDAERSERHYRDAIHAAESCGMDLFNIKVLGIRAAVADMFDKLAHPRSAVEEYNGLIASCQMKLADIDRGVLPTDAGPDYRQNILKMILRCRVKMATIYESDKIRNPIKAKEIMSDTIGLLVRETQNPETKSFSEDNAAGLTLDEIASMLSQMGDLFATTGEESNAVQVYMSTLAPLRRACDGTKSCREAQVLSNIASSMDLAMKKPGATINGQPATEELRAAARKATMRWADQAIATAGAVLPENRDDICDTALLSAELTRADLLLEDGQLIRAKEGFRNLVPRLKERNLYALVKTAEQGMQRADK